MLVNIKNVTVENTNVGDLILTDRGLVFMIISNKSKYNLLNMTNGKIVFASDYYTINDLLSNKINDRIIGSITKIVKNSNIILSENDKKEDDWL